MNRAHALIMLEHISLMHTVLEAQTPRHMQ
jgi:hypothetical protein